METATVVQPEKMQSEVAEKTRRVDVFRYQRWADGDGKLWIVTLTFGFDGGHVWGAKVELLDVDNERTIDVPRAEFEGWVRAGTLKRVELPILM